MIKAVAVLALGSLVVALGACCGSVEPRFWSARSSMGTLYAVDTAEAPFGQVFVGDFLDENGQRVSSAPDYTLSPISQDEWVRGTKGASWGINYCMSHGVCWAKPKPR